ncbi:MAG TPA: hypothetical protein VLE95_05600 [Chlamydiales bacterium]|nr:hypothetical protein [Chlamydiales bacterium]
MVKRKTHKSVSRKAVSRKKTATKKAKGKELADSSTRSLQQNEKAHWSVYKDLHKQADKAWNKLRADVKRNAPPHVLMADRNNLLLLLGECNYLAGECKRICHRWD